MKTMVPVCDSGAAERICSLGNVELYCGYYPQWLASERAGKKGLVVNAINNRLRASDNVTRFEELASIVKIASRRSADVFLALNSRMYSNSQMRDMRRYLDELLAAGVENVIISDLNLIFFLIKEYPTLRITISCLAQVTNTESVRFYRELGNVRRFVLPRHMSVEEVEDMAEHNSDAEFEFFIFSNKCLFDDGFCRAKHEAGQICRQQFERLYVSSAECFTPEDIVVRESNSASFRLWTTDYTKKDQGSFRCNHFACSACAVADLIRIPNIVSAKLSIRGHSINELFAQASLSNRVIAIAEQGGFCKDIRNEISTSLNIDHLCADGFNCLMRSSL